MILFILWYLSKLLHLPFSPLLTDRYFISLSNWTGNLLKKTGHASLFMPDSCSSMHTPGLVLDREPNIYSSYKPVTIRNPVNYLTRAEWEAKVEVRSMRWILIRSFLYELGKVLLWINSEIVGDCYLVQYFYVYMEWNKFASIFVCLMKFTICVRKLTNKPF